jgi:polysaccharide biosynthesis transport protein
MTFEQFLTILKARARLALAVAIGVVAAVLAGSLLWPKQYTASASVVVDVKSRDPILGTVLSEMMAVGYMATQVDLIQSEPVALRAIRALRLNEDGELREQWHEATKGRGDFGSWLAELLAKKLEVTPSRESNVITIEYTSASSEFAAAMVNAIVQAYIDTTVELKVEPARQYNAFFDERAKQAREAVEQAQTRLSAFQQQRGITAIEEHLDVESARLNELSTQLVALQAVAAESEGRELQAGSNARSMTEVVTNSVVGGLTAELSRQDARLNELEQRLGPRHPQVLELRANIEQLRSRIFEETRVVSGSLRVNNKVNESRLTQLRSALAAQRDKVMQLKGERDESAVLLRDVENARRVYDSMMERASQTSVESQSTLTNVNRLKAATEPALPSSPRVILNVALALVVGSLLGVGVAVSRELTDRRVRTEGDVVQGLRQTMLVMMPGPDRRESRNRKRIGQTKARVLNGLPGPQA